MKKERPDSGLGRKANQLKPAERNEGHKLLKTDEFNIFYGLLTGDSCGFSQTSWIETPGLPVNSICRVLTRRRHFVKNITLPPSPQQRHEGNWEEAEETLSILHCTRKKSAKSLIQQINPSRTALSSLNLGTKLLVCFGFALQCSFGDLMLFNIIWKKSGQSKY